MDLAERNPGGMSSMDEMLSIPFDQLWRRSDGSSHRFQQANRPVTTRIRAPDVNYEALRVLGGSQHVVSFGGEGGSYQELVQLDEGRVRRGVKPRVLHTMPEQVIPKDKGLQCHICMEVFDGAKTARQLPCNHVFCKSCILQWLADHDTCPTCRWKFPEDQTELVLD